MRALRPAAAGGSGGGCSIRAEEEEEGEEELPGREAAPVGEVGGGDTRPEEGGSGLARHLRHRRGCGSRVRQGGHRVPRRTCEAQLPELRLLVGGPRGTSGNGRLWSGGFSTTTGCSKRSSTRAGNLVIASRFMMRR